MDTGRKKLRIILLAAAFVFSLGVAYAGAKALAGMLF